MRVAELMQSNLRLVAADASVADAIYLLADARVSALPVVDRFGRAVGILTTRDVLEAERDSADRNHLLQDTLVLEIMTPWAATVGPDIDVQDAARQMLYLDVQRLFVEDHGRLVGVISQTDIVGAVATAGV